MRRDSQIFEGYAFSQYKRYYNRGFLGRKRYKSLRGILLSVGVVSAVSLGALGLKFSYDYVKNSSPFLAIILTNP